jgi:hypothetical protein
MKKIWFIVFLCLFFSSSLNICAQSSFQSREISEDDGIPVLIKHLPDWENARNRAIITNNVADLKSVLGERPVFDLIDFTGGTEAVTAPYEAGKLLIIEYVTPQASVAADEQFKQRLAELPPTPQIFYRRIGNYNVFVFDGSDEAAANALFDQIKYEKVVQWLGDDPKYAEKVERYLAQSTAQLFLSTIIAIISTLSVTFLIGVIAGLVFYRIREKKRASMMAFSDAGGMIRLNLDGMTPPIPTDKLLKN